MARSGLAPAFSAQTNWLFDRARSAILPLPRSTMSNCWAVPIVSLFAINGVPVPAVTYLPLARARRLIVPVPGPAFGRPMVALSHFLAAVAGVPDNAWNGCSAEPVFSTR